MKTKVIKIYKILLGVVLLLTLSAALAITTSAESDADYEYVHLMGSSSLTVSPEGYSVNGGSSIAHTGAYFISGEAGRDIHFKNDTGERVTYDVVLHELRAYSETYYACVSIDSDVTLNLTVYGEAMLVGSNHAGIKAKPGVIINITITENSTLFVGNSDFNTDYCIEGDPEINIISGHSNVDMEADPDWAGHNDEIIFSNGNALERHTVTPSRIPGDESRHSLTCAVCGPLATTDHRITYRAVDAESHSSVCEICGIRLTPMDHEFSDGECTLCDASIVFIHKDADGNSKNFISFEDAIDYAKENGGELVLQKSIYPYNAEIGCDNVSYTLDFNGYSINNAYFAITSTDSSATLTLTDRSENGGGKLYQSMIGNILYSGTVIIDGVGGMSNVYASGGDVVINSGEYYNLAVAASNGGSITVNDITVSYLDIIMENLNPATDEISLAGGSYGGINLTDSDPLSEDITFIADLLADGCALFDGDGNIANAYMLMIDEDMTIAPHTHDFDNGIMGVGEYTHVEICACGVRDSDAEETPHTPGSDGLCVGCGADIVASLATDGGVLYFVDVASALELAYRMDGELVTLLSDNDVSVAIIDDGNLTLDLNGYELWVTGSEIHVGPGATLTIVDLSDGGGGKLGYKDNTHYTAIGVEGRLVIESGDIYCCIDAYNHSDEVAEIIINGGELYGGIILYDDTSVTVNGGVFYDENVFSYYFDDEQTAEITLNGGIFEHGLSTEDEHSMTVKGFLSADAECGVFFVDEDGNAAIFESDKEYNGYLAIAHDGAEVISDGFGHSYFCETCDIVYGYEPHGAFTYVASGDKHDAICGVCEYNTGADEHVGGRASCIDLAVCDLCGSEYGTVDTEAHEGGVANCVSPAICVLCESAYGEKNGKNHVSTDTVYVSNGDKHDKKRACCGIVLDSFSHGYDGACDTGCNVCGATRTVNHVYDVDGRCIGCGAEGGESRAESPATVDEKLFFALVAATVVVFGGGAFAIIWFVIRKKFMG